MQQYLFIIIGFLLSGAISYYLGYSKGKAYITDNSQEKQEQKWTTLTVVGIVFVIIGVAVSISLDIWKEQHTTRQILGILTVIILSGSLGGLIGNYYRKQKNDPNFKNFDLLASVLLGIGASLLVPVLLHILTSNLLTEIGSQPEKAFILAGFCLAAAISGEPFIGVILDYFNDLAINKTNKKQITTENLPVNTNEQNIPNAHK